MTIDIQLPEKQSLKPSITVFGVGGGGGNAVNNMINSNLEGVGFVVANTDAQAIEESTCNSHIQLGESITQGLGAGSYPEVGKASAEEAVDEILDYLQGSNMVFITAGLGGGTGTGAAPVVARLAKERGILTVAVVTKPFAFEGTHRMRVAELGLQELQKYVDTLIVIPNQNLFRVADKNTTFLDAFKLADEVLHSGVRGITDLMTMPGLINLDFSDVRSVMSEMGKAMMGTGEASGENRAIDAADAAIANPLLDNVSMQGARGVLINITGGYDMTLFEVDEAANRIREEVDPEANIIFGSTFNKDYDGQIRVSVVATGIDLENNTQQEPVNIGKREIPFPAQKESESSQNNSIPNNPSEEEIVPSQNNLNIDNSHVEKKTELKPVQENKRQEEERPQIQEMTLSDLFSSEQDKQPRKENRTNNNADIDNRNTESNKEKKSIFIAPEPIEPKNMNQPENKSFGSDLSNKNKKNQSDNSNAKELKLPENIFSDSEDKSSGGSIFGNIFGSSNKKKAEESPKEAVQPTKKQEAIISDKDELDIPAFLRRKSD